jgi:hypothetical protein
MRARKETFIKGSMRQHDWEQASPLAEGIVHKFVVSPQSIADHLALVGDSADGYAGLIE